MSHRDSGILLSKGLTDDLFEPDTTETIIVDPPPALNEQGDDLDEDEDAWIRDIDETLADYEGINLQASSSSNIEMPLPEKEGYAYFGGVLARKCLKQKLSIVDNNLLKNENFIQSQWLDARNVGGLNYPRKSLIADLEKMELMFREYHSEYPDGLSREVNVTKNFAAKLHEKFSQYDLSFLRTFSRARTIFRMRHMINETFLVESQRAKEHKVSRLYSKAAKKSKLSRI